MKARKKTKKGLARFLLSGFKNRKRKKTALTRLGQLFHRKKNKKSSKNAVQESTRHTLFRTASKKKPLKKRKRSEKRIDSTSPLPSSAAAPSVPIVVTPSVASGGDLLTYSLTTQDILRPNDLLRQSIEAFLLDQRSPHTRLAYGKDLKRFLKFLHARNHQQGFETMNRTLLIAYKEYLLSESLEHTTVDRHLATLKSFFQWLVDDGHIVRSPADGVRFMNPKRMSTTIGFSDEEVKKILILPNLHTRTGALHYAILMILFYCGLRRSELCSLKMANLGEERNQRVIRLRGKGNAERMIVMIPPVWNAVRYYLFISNRNQQVDEFLFTPIRNNRTGILDKPLDPSMIFYIVRKYARLAGITNRVSPHSCRATAISNARDHHVSDRAIQEFAGWASPDMITRYDKRKSSLEDSAAHSISYGNEHEQGYRSSTLGTLNHSNSETVLEPSSPSSRDPEVESQ